jgi:8-oxo-dGTP diphosphatase
MKHRIAAGVLIVENEKVLLVRHQKEGVYDFWVAPGGGAEGNEDLIATAQREVKEETGLQVEVMKLAYVEEFSNPHTRELKVWFTGRVIGGSLNANSVEAQREFITEVAWLDRSDFQGRTIFPTPLLHDYWTDRDTGFAFPRYIGLRAMEFY